MAVAQAPSQLPKAVKGIIDLTNVDLTQYNIPLEGEWEFYYSKLLEPQAFAIPMKPDYLQVPLLWNNAQLHGEPLKAKAYATYRLKVLLPKRVQVEDLALDVPDAYSSLRMFINSYEFFNLGKPGTTPHTTTPLFRPSAKRLSSVKDSFYITLQVANFHHSRGGLVRPIMLGNNDDLKKIRELSRGYDIFLTGSLFMGGLFFLGLFIFGRQDKAILYFSLFCLLYAYRVIGTEEYALHHIFPKLSWFLTIRLEYATLFAAVIFLALFNYNLYPREFNKQFLSIFLFACGIGFLLSTFGSTSLFTSITPVFLVLLTGKLTYTMYVYVLGFLHKRPGAIYSLASTFLLLVLFVIIVFGYYSNIYPGKGFLTLLYILFFFFQSLVLSHRFAYQLNSAREEAIKAYQAKSEFLSTMSHEIRTPLNSVIGITNLLLQKNPKGEQKEYLDTLLFSANNLLYIINDILDFSKIEAGKMTLQYRPTVLGLIGARIVSTLKVLAQEKGVALNFDCPPDIMRVAVMADPDRTTQVINNLIHNGIKFTSKGSVTLRMQVLLQNATHLQVRISVIDTGIGIPIEKQKLIFDEFTQADATIQKGYGGTGLGLSISKEILKIQKVELFLSSTPGLGSTFWFDQNFEIAQSPQQVAVHANQQAELVEMDNLKERKIMVVEDNTINMMVAEKILRSIQPDFTIYKATNGEEAVEMYTSLQPDLILMDVNMPIMDGLTAAAIIRKQEAESGKHTPIIALTAGTMREDKERCIEAGMDTMIAKPFKVDELRQTLIEMLSK